MATAVCRRERGLPDEAEALLDEALRDRGARKDDPETESWSLGSKSAVLADRGETEAALAIALRNCELTERLGDVFSRGMALTSRAYVHLEGSEFGAGLEAVEQAESGYREARGAGSETEGWRATLRARALLGLERPEDALAVIEPASAEGRRRGLNWQLPPTLLTLAQARAALGMPGVAEALDEATAIATDRGQTMSLERIEAERAALSAG